MTIVRRHCLGGALLIPLAAREWSRLRQVEDGISLEDRQRRIDGRAIELCCQVDRIFVEKGVSASLPLAERPEGKKLLGRLKRGDRVISPKLDRMFRDARDALNTIDRFKSQHVSLVLLDIGGDVTAQNGNGIAKMLFTILAAVAEWERDRTRERILDSKEWARDQGRFMGGIRPFGYQIVERDGVKMLEPDPVEQEVMAEMVTRREAGESIRAIQLWALDRGHKINHHTVHNIVEKRK